VCRPRPWLPDCARLFNGNGYGTFSSGLATRPRGVRRPMGGRECARPCAATRSVCETRAPRDPRGMERTRPPAGGAEGGAGCRRLKEEDLLPDPNMTTPAGRALAPIPPKAERDN